MEASLRRTASPAARTEAAVHLFTPFTLRTVTFRNRIVVSPMCQYSSVDGFASDWHLVHLGSRAVGGAGLVLTESAAVRPEGRSSPANLGIWKDEHIPVLRRVTQFIHEHGAVSGIQLGHGGRKASAQIPWEGDRVLGEAEGGWQPVGPSPIPFREDDPVPRALSHAEIAEIVGSYASAAGRALRAAFE